MTLTPALLFRRFADRWHGPIDAALDSFSRPGAGCPERLSEAIRYSLLAPGKRLRPLLTLMATQTCGGEPIKAMPAAAAVEMIHAYSLIHDDLPAMDDDDLRRGRPTCHIRFDEATAILAGDALQAMAVSTIGQNIRPRELAGDCCLALAEAAGPNALVGGQADDMTCQGERITFENMQSIHARKTGALIRVSLVMGAMIADASMEQVDEIRRYGEKIGLAFQITDDLLDVEGDEHTMGKRLRKDEAQGKATYPTLLGIEESHRLAEEAIAEAQSAVKPFGEPAFPLIGLADYILTRKK
jgi:geranylgeranyl diphosphate synthase, type II